MNVLDNVRQKLDFRPVDRSNWHDLERLFEAPGGPKHCWCMVWRNMKNGTSRKKKGDKKTSLRNHVNRSIPIGILCYDNKEPVAWCSIAPRDTYRNLSGDASLGGVWSLVCFFIKRSYRGQGMSALLINEARRYAKRNGATYLEAYPVAPDAPSYRFMGRTTTFGKLGFRPRGKAGLRRNVMLSEL